MTERLAAEVPFWEPGTRNGYHGFTFGWTVGEMVRRASGKSLGTFFQDEIAKPLGLDFWIGLPEEIEPRVAPIDALRLQGGRQRDAVHARPRHQQAIDRRPVLSSTSAPGAPAAPTRAPATPPRSAPPTASPTRAASPACTRRWRTAAASWSMRTTLARMGEVSMATHDDATLRIPTRFALGFMKSMDNRKRSLGAKICRARIATA